MCYTWSMAKQYSTNEVAAMLGYSQSRILQICKDHSLPRVGNQYVLSDLEIEAIKKEIGHKPSGRPRKENK
jgi:hypothetical protein